MLYHFPAFLKLSSLMSTNYPSFYAQKYFCVPWYQDQYCLCNIFRPSSFLDFRQQEAGYAPSSLDRVLNFNMKSHGTQLCTSAPAALTAKKTLPRTNSFEFPGPIIRLISTGQDNESDNTDKLPSRPKRIMTSPRRHSVVLTRAAQLAEQEPPRLSKSKSFCGPLFARIESE